MLSNHPSMRLYTANDLPNPEKIYLPDMNNNVKFFYLDNYIVNLINVTKLIILGLPCLWMR